MKVEDPVSCEIEVIPLTSKTHTKCARCYRYVPEVFPYDPSKDSICRRCCIVMWDIEHGFVGTDYAAKENQT